MKISIAGMNGFVGQELKRRFTAGGHCVVGLKVRTSTTPESIAAELEGRDVVINLSGANILARWNDPYKAELYASRIDTTRKVAEAMGVCKSPPKVLLSASAVGIYDAAHCHTETSSHLADDFLGNLCTAWENEAWKAAAHGTRVCTMRFGVIYGKGGGAMGKMLLPFRLGVGGKLGNGNQKVSWIHLDDLVGGIEHLMCHEELAGVFNFTAPGCVTNAEQTRLLAKALGRPAFMTVPAFAVKLLFGEGATVVLDSKEVYPQALLDSGYTFTYPTLDAAFSQIVS